MTNEHFVEAFFVFTRERFQYSARRALWSMFPTCGMDDWELKMFIRVYFIGMVTAIGPIVGMDAVAMMHGHISDILEGDEWMPDESWRWNRDSFGPDEVLRN